MLEVCAVGESYYVPVKVKSILKVAAGTGTSGS